MNRVLTNSSASRHHGVVFRYVSRVSVPGIPVMDLKAAQNEPKASQLAIIFDGNARSAATERRATRQLHVQVTGLKSPNRPSEAANNYKEIQCRL